MPLAHTADAIFLSGRIITNDPQRPTAQAVALANGKVIAVGSNEEVQALASERTSITPLDDAFVFPGLVDAHAHVLGLGLHLRNVDLVGTKSLSEVVTRVATRAKKEPSGWITGRGWDQNDWAQQDFPTAAALEAVIPGRLVWIRRVDGHAGLASRAALKAAGITRNSKDPAGGRILRDSAGEPTGVLVDNAMDVVEAAIPKSSEAEVRSALLAGLQRAAEVGITEVHDMSVSVGTLSVLRALAREGALPIRIYAVLAGDDPALDKILAHGPIVEGNLTVRAVKFFADGALGSRGAALLAPYSDDPKNQGLLVATENDLAANVVRVARAGFQPCVHAIGDRANRIVLDIFERNLTATQRKQLRPRIEHAQVVAPEDLPRFAALGVIASMQPTHATSDMPWAEARLGASRLPGAYAWATLKTSGATLAFGSDFPVEAPEILDGVYASLSRQDGEGKPLGGWQAEERLSFNETLKAFTDGAAFAGFSEANRGRVAVGMDADLTIVRGNLEQSILGGDEAAFRAWKHAEILMTIVGGRKVYEKQAAGGMAATR